MIPEAAFYRDLAYVFLAAVVGGALAWAARQPLVLGYVVGGILVSPLTPGPAVSDIRTFEIFAEIGVILLMFSIGIEFSLRDLLRVKWVAALGGPLGVLLSIGLAIGVGALLGWPVLQAAVVGMVVSVCSTMVLARQLLDRGDLHSRHGRVMIGIALVEDLAVVVLIVLMPQLGALEPGRLGAIARALGLAAAILVPFFFLAAKAVPALLQRVARTHSPELFLLVALAIAPGTAALTQAVGLSLALGALLAGLLISESDYAHETLARSLLELAGAARAALVVVALPEAEAAHRVVRNARAINPAVPILARVHHPAAGDQLLAAGATEVIQPELEAASTLIRHALRSLDMPRDRVVAYVERFREAMEALPREAAGQALPEVREVAIEAGELADQSLEEARIRERFGVTVIALRRAGGDMVLHPSAETIMRPGDRLMVFGLPAQIAAFVEAARTGS